MWNFSELKTKVAELAQRSNDDNYKTKIGTWLQMSHKFLADINDLWIDLQDVYNFSATGGKEDYPLPNRFDKPFRLYDLTNDKKLTVITEEEYFDGHITAIADAEEQTAPEYARIYGVAGSSVPIATTGDTVKAKSSNATESVAIIVTVSGYIDSSLLIEDSEDITIVAASANTFVAGTKTFYKITKIAKSANTTGYIIIANSTGTTIETLAPHERIARHRVLKLGKIPSQTNSMRLLFKKIPYEMVNDYDYPFCECDRYLIMDAWGWALKQDDKEQQAAFAWGKAKEALETLLLNNSKALGTSYQHKIISNWLQAHRI